MYIGLMNKLFTIFFIVFSCSVFAQKEEILPRFLSPSEREMIGDYTPPTTRGIETPPPFENLRNMAEWEEVQALTITWRSYPSILKQIVRASQEETEVIIFSENAGNVESYLMGSQAGGPLESMEGVSIVDAPSNSIWIRDYGANTVYGNRVDTLFLVDWIYNRPRPADDLIPDALADFMEINLYSTTATPFDVVNTGGNFMSDGQGTAFSSELVLEENAPGSPWVINPKDEDEIDEILGDFQGLSEYIKMTALPYDIINHIDMHMKLLDEETLLVGEYPEGIADGPQINANIDYVINSFNSHFETPYNVKRIPMPDSPSGLYPDDNPAGYYRTYTNGVFVNKTFLYPSYREEYDTTAARIYAELLPGYNVVPIDCDDQPDLIIAAAGAIHCITHSVGVDDPLLIVHQPLADTEDDLNPYLVEAEIEHRTGISNAELHWRIQGEESYNSVAMDLVSGSTWSGFIPEQAVGTDIEYYVAAAATNGKTQTRPIVAPDGYWQFRVTGAVVGTEQIENLKLNPVYPNPAFGLISIPLIAETPDEVHIYISDMAGRKVMDVFKGNVYGDRRISQFVDQLAPGVYIVVAEGKFGKKTTPLVVVNR